MNQLQQALIPSEQKQVLFYDDEITAVLVQRTDGPEIYVSVRQMCDLLGVSYQGQIRRINDDPVLSKQLKGVNITFTPSGGRGGGAQETNCLPLDYLNGWLFGINPNRVKAEIRDRLILYQEKCFKVLADAFRERRLTTDQMLDELLQQSNSEAVQAYRMLQALVKLAHNQVVMEAELGEQRRQIDAHSQQITAYGERLEDIEATLGNPDRHVTAEQASQLSQAVKAVALKLSQQSRRNEYGGVYGEMYRRFDITSYKQLPARKFNAAMAWLSEWYQQITNSDEVPF